jgi:hypothetical protein
LAAGLGDGNLMTNSMIIQLVCDQVGLDPHPDMRLTKTPRGQLAVYQGARFIATYVIEGGCVRVLTVRGPD